MTPDPLSEAVDALTKIRIETIRTDNGPLTVTADPRLQMLRDAIRSSMSGRGGGTSLASERAALNSDALHKALMIQSQIGDWCRNAGVKPTRDSITDLEAWHTANPDAGDWYVAQLEKWAREIDAMLNPVKRFDITTHCPICGLKEWTNHDGERCMWPLKAETPTMRVLCLACDAVWDGVPAVEELREELDEKEAG